MENSSSFQKAEEKEEEGFQEIRQHLLMADGTKISVQASRGHYCNPRKDGLKTKYSAVEVRYLSSTVPSEFKNLTESYGENEATCDRECYEQFFQLNWLPAENLLEIIKFHGGIIGGHLPMLDINTTSENDKDRETNNEA
tara:strand:- start:139 stop:558 length:420 start_codon:yes stop_codon:yes gene_type:complete